MTSERSSGENAALSDGLDEAELIEVEQCAARAFAVASAPWIAQLGSAARFTALFTRRIRATAKADIDAELACWLRQA